MFHMSFLNASIFVAALALSFIATRCLVRVPRGKLFVVESSGGSRRALRSGLCLIAPFGARIARKLEASGALIVDFEIASGKGKVVVNGDALYRVIDPVKAAYGVSDHRKALKDLIEKRLKIATQSLKAKEIVAARSALVEKTMRTAGKPAAEFGVEITKLEIDIFEA